MTTVNTILLGAAMAFFSAAVATLTTNWIAASVELVAGVLAIVVYEKLPPSTPPTP